VSQDILEIVDIFSDLSAEQLALIDSMNRELVFIQGEQIFAGNSPSSDFFVILEGEVEPQIESFPTPPGKKRAYRTITAVLRKGRCSGEIALVKGLRSTSAICSSMICQMLPINWENFMSLLGQDLDMGFKVVSDLASDLCFKFRQINLSLLEIMLYSPLAEA
jgi:CRP-like cAMP-binding protein